MKNLARNTEIVAAWLSGEFQYVIAERYGLAASSVSAIIRRMKAKRAQPCKSARNARLADDYRAGATLAELSAKYGIGMGRASVILKRMGARADDAERHARIMRGIARAKAAGLKPGPSKLPYSNDPAYIKMRCYFGATYARQQFEQELRRAA